MAANSGVMAGPFTDASIAIAHLSDRRIRTTDDAVMQLKNDIDEYWRTANRAGYEGFAFIPPTPQLTGDDLDALIASRKLITSPAVMDLVSQHPALHPKTMQYLAGLYRRVWSSGTAAQIIPLSGKHDTEFLMRCLSANPNLTGEAFAKIAETPTIIASLLRRADRFPTILDTAIDYIPQIDGANLIETIRELLDSPRLTRSQAQRLIPQVRDVWNKVQESSRDFAGSYTPRPSDEVALARAIANPDWMHHDVVSPEDQSFFLVIAST